MAVLIHFSSTISTLTFNMTDWTLHLGRLDGDMMETALTCLHRHVHLPRYLSAILFLLAGRSSCRGGIATQ